MALKDVIIVGGGPIGCFTGEKLSEKGLEVTILEEDKNIGHPMCCAGIVGHRGMKEVGIDPEKWSANKLTGGTVFSPKMEKVNMSRNKLEAHCIKRSEFDKGRAIEAVKKGAEIKLEARCTDVTVKKDKVKVDVRKDDEEKKLEARTVVGADGGNSLVARELDLIKEFSPLSGAQAQIIWEGSGKNAKIFFSNKWSENFFAWVVPAGNVLRVGLCDKGKNVRKKLHQFIKDNPALPENASQKITSFTTDIIPQSGKRKIFSDRALLVGDAAGQIKPLTGGGIYMGMSCAKIAAEVLYKSLEKEPNEKALSKYGKRVEEKFGREYELGNRVMNVLSNMEDEDIENFFQLLKEEEFQETILKNFKFDEHSHLLKKLIRKLPHIANSVGIINSLKYLKWFL